MIREGETDLEYCVRGPTVVDIVFWCSWLKRWWTASNACPQTRCYKRLDTHTTSHTTLSVSVCLRLSAFLLTHCAWFLLFSGIAPRKKIIKQWNTMHVSGRTFRQIPPYSNHICCILGILLEHSHFSPLFFSSSLSPLPLSSPISARPAPSW